MSVAASTPLDAAVAVAGMDLIEVGADGIRSMTGCFDRPTPAEQLGLEAITQPAALGPVTLGTRTHLRTRAPGAGWGGQRRHPGGEHGGQGGGESGPRARGDDGPGRVARLPGLDQPAGRHADDDPDVWGSVEGPRALRDGPHDAATARFLADDGLAAGGITTVWEPVKKRAGCAAGERKASNSSRPALDNAGRMAIAGRGEGRRFAAAGRATGFLTGSWAPHRMNDTWMRCPACARMQAVNAPGLACACGAALPEPGICC